MHDDMQPDTLNPAPAGAQQDHEGAMARADLYKLANYSLKLFKKLDDSAQLEGWVQAKITKAMDYLDTARDYMKANKYAEDMEVDEARKPAFNFDGEDIEKLNKIDDLPTLKAQAFELISKPSQRPMKPEKVEWFKNALEKMINKRAVIKLMYDLLLSGEGHGVIGNVRSDNYRKRFSDSIEHPVDEAKYRGKNVPLGKKLPGDVKKSKVYVRKPNGNIVKVNFGDKKIRIKKSNP